MLIARHYLKPFFIHSVMKQLHIPSVLVKISHIIRRIIAYKHIYKTGVSYKTSSSHNTIRIKVVYDIKEVAACKYIAIVAYWIMAFLKCQCKSLLVNITYVIIGSYSWMNNKLFKRKLIIYCKNSLPFVWCFNTNSCLN